MANQKQVVIFVNDQIIKATEVSPDGASKTVLDSKWETRTLSKLLSKVKNDTKVDKIRVIVGDNLAFMSPIFVDKDAENIKSEVLTKAQETLPEDIDNLGVDWKKIATIGDRFAIQIFAMQKSFLSLLGRASQTAELNIESIEPVAYILARHFKSLDTPHLIIWENDAVFASIVHQGQVLASDTITTLDVYTQIEALVLFVQTEYQLSVEKIILASETNKVDQNKLEAKTKLDLKVEKINLYLDASEKEDTSGLDEEVLNITPKEVFSDEDEEPMEEEVLEEDAESEEIDDQQEDQDVAEDPDNEPEPETRLKAPSLPLAKTKEPDMKEQQVVEVVSDNPKKSGGSSLKFLAVGIFILTLVSGLVLGGLYVYNSAKSKTSGNKTEEQAAEAVPTPEPTPTPTPEPEIDKSELKIQVLNGSGVPGRAGSVQSLLEDAGYGDVAAANASSFDFETTEISVKDGNDTLLKLLTKDLEGDYEIGDTDTELDADSDYDAVITIGKNTAEDTEAEDSN